MGFPFQGGLFMKICIIGFSGAGKSTLARILGKHYSIPVLHLDRLHFEANWRIKDRELFVHEIKDFLKNNTNWIIEGNYTKYVKERFLEADGIIYLSYNRFTCCKNVIKRYQKYKNKTREDMAVGCKEKLDLEFLYWVFHKGRTLKKKKQFKQMVLQAKSGIILKNRKKLNQYLNKIGVNQNEISC